MTELLTAAQMRAIEQAAIESGAVTGLELMERAGRGVVEAIFEEWPELADAPAAGGEGGAAPSAFGIHPRDISGQKKRRAVILCGPGNNGGDGFVVARLLHEQGWEVEVFLYGDPEKLPPDARVNYERWGEIGSVSSHKGIDDRTTAKTDLFIDALFGTGLARGIGRELRKTLVLLTQHAQGIRAQPMIRKVAIDIESGLDADSGRLLKCDPPEDWYEGYSPDLVVSFETAKLGHMLGAPSGKSGTLKVCEIGLRDHLRDLRRSDEIATLAIPDVSCLAKGSGTHKYSHGHALILTGSSGHTGAARLAARGALRVGAGLVTLGVPAEAQQEVASQITAIMMRQIGEARALEEVLKDGRLNALCLGPGLGLERARELVPVVLRGGLETHPTRAVVLDADALTAYADTPDELFGMLHQRCVLTPHAGEFARLFPDIAEKLQAPAKEGPAYSKVDATRDAAERAGCTVLFKGPDTVIADSSGACVINSAAYDREAPWLATAGSGDVLAGFITGLLARGFAPMQAAETAAWLHVECALEVGPGLIAEDLPEMLPAVFKKLGA